MTDIVERLRRQLLASYCNCNAQEDQAITDIVGKLFMETQALRAEIERLRAALQRIADYDGTHGESVRELARRALEPKND